MDALNIAQLPEEYRPKEGKGYSFQSKRALLTYKTHINKDDLLQENNEAVGVKFAFWRAAHETGMSSGVAYEHTHVLIEFGGGRAFKTTNSRRFDIDVGADGVSEIIHPNIRAIKTDEHWKHCMKYIAKEDEDNIDLKVEAADVTCLAEGIWACDTKAEALRLFADTPGKAPGIIAMFEAKPRPKVIVDEPEHPWQLSVIELIQSVPDKRSVWWFYDPIGATGKTQLARYLINENLAHVVKQVGNGNSFATIISNALDSGWNGRAIVFDIPRSFEARDALYECLETCADGMVTTTKYSGKTVVFNQPHVIVLANYLPERKKMSADRWRVHQIRQADLDIDELDGSESTSTGSHPMDDYLPQILSEFGAEEIPNGNLKVTEGLNIIAPRTPNPSASSVLSTPPRKGQRNIGNPLLSALNKDFFKGFNNDVDQFGPRPDNVSTDSEDYLSEFGL